MSDDINRNTYVHTALVESAAVSDIKLKLQFQKNSKYHSGASNQNKI